MRTLTVGLFIIAITICCNSYKEYNLHESLASECFWDRVRDKSVIGGLNSCFRFLPNGECFFYYYNFYNKIRTDSVYRYEDGCVVVPNTWSTIGDSLLVIRGIKYKVLAFSTDSVSLRQRNGDSIFLKKNCQTFIENELPSFDAPNMRLGESLGRVGLAVK